MFFSGWLSKTTWQGSWGRKGCFLVWGTYAGLGLPPGQGCSVTYSLNSHSHSGGIRCRDAWNMKSDMLQRRRERGRAGGRAVPCLFHTFWFNQSYRHCLLLCSCLPQKARPCPKLQAWTCRVMKSLDVKWPLQTSHSSKVGKSSRERVCNPITGMTKEYTARSSFSLKHLYAWASSYHVMLRVYKNWHCLCFKSVQSRCPLPLSTIISQGNFSGTQNPVTLNCKPICNSESALVKEISLQKHMKMTTSSWSIDGRSSLKFFFAQKILNILFACFLYVAFLWWVMNKKAVKNRMQVQSPRSERDKDSICHREIQKSKYQHRTHLPKRFYVYVKCGFKEQKCSHR